MSAHIFINKHLTPAESKAAYDARVLRRTKKGGSTSSTKPVQPGSISSFSAYDPHKSEPTQPQNSMSGMETTTTPDSIVLPFTIPEQQGDLTQPSGSNQHPDM